MSLLLKKGQSQRQEEYSIPKQAHMTCTVTTGRVWKEALEEVRGLPVGLFCFLHLTKHSSKCSGVVAYGAFDFVCV